MFQFDGEHCDVESVWDPRKMRGHPDSRKCMAGTSFPPEAYTLLSKMRSLKRWCVNSNLA